MRKKTFSLVFAVISILTVSRASWAQQCPIPDFDDVIAFCTQDNEYGITYPADTTSLNVDFWGTNALGCLGSTPSPAWFAMQIAEDGPIYIELSHSESQDIDFACFGPFEGTSKIDMLKKVCSASEYYMQLETPWLSGGDQFPSDCTYSPEFEAINDSIQKYQDLIDETFVKMDELEQLYYDDQITYEEYDQMVLTQIDLYYLYDSLVSPFLSLDPRYYDITSNCFRSKWDQFPNGHVVDCSYSTNAREICHIENAKKDEWYILLVTNFSQVEGTISFSNVGQSVPTNCDIIIDASVNDVCEGGDISFYVNNAPKNATFVWTGPNGFYSTDKNPVIPDASKEHEGTYTVQMCANGIYSPVVPLEVKVNPIRHVDTTVTIKRGESFLIGGDALTDEGTYSYQLTTKEGCDSLVTLHLNVTLLDMTSNGPLCEKETLVLSVEGGSPDAVFSWTTPRGSVLNGSSISIPDVTRYDGGQYQLTMSANGNVENVGSIDVVVHPFYIVQMDTVLRSGETITLGTQNIVADGMYTETLKTLSGCDSIVTLFVTEVGKNSFCNAPLCVGGTLTMSVSDFYPESSLHWYGPNNFTQDGGLEVTIADVKASDAGEYVVKTDVFLSTTGEMLEYFRIPVEIYDKIEVDTTVTILTGQSYVFGSKQLTAEGTYTETFSSAHGCDSTVRLTLQVLDPSAAISANGPLCEGDTLVISLASCNVPSSELLWSGPNNFTQDGGLELTIKGVKASDAGEYIVKSKLALGPTTNLQEIARTVVEVYGKVEVDTTVTILTGQSYTFGSNQLTTAGTYTETFLSAQGCDSVVHLTLKEENPDASISNNGPVCEDETLSITVVSNHYPESSLHWFGPNNFTQDGGFELTINGAKTSDAGEYIVKTDLFQGVTGELQEVARTVVEVYGKTEVDTTVTILTGQSYTFGSNQLTTAGTYTEKFLSAHGCDSVVHLTLLEETPEATISNNGPVCEGDVLSIIVASKHYPESSLHWFGPNNFTRDGGFELTINGAKASDAGEYIVKTDLFQETTGDLQEVVRTVVEVFNKIDVDTTATILTGESYLFGSTQLTAGGTYTETFLSAQGCDSTVHLTLKEETPSATISNNGPLCEDETLSIVVTSDDYPESTLHWFGPNNFTQDGGFEVTINGAKASDAGEYIVKTDMFQGELKEVVRTKVDIYSKSDIDTTISILRGESYPFGSNQLTTEGTYTETFSSEHGCDSTVRLALRVEELNVTISDNGPLCEGEALSLSAQEIPERVQVQWIGPKGFVSNDPDVTITNVSARDSGTYQLVVSVMDKSLDTFSTHVDVYTKDKVTLLDSMSGDSYMFGDMLIEKPGVYTLSFQNEHGCDSVVTLHLSWVMDTFQIIPDPYFTPNGDGVRDSWYIENIAKYPSTVKIFDRYGKIIRLYEMYENENGWDGKDENGKDVPASDYWYLINNSYQDTVFVGHVTVLR
ncbi:MAG: T9SS type B sorting domain-containing protein [Paludibacteraceae bacterium]|nr:T9SS type B sorting domain-containing protein [Paludibacteraceae bacterium]MBP5481459.1 T9SS type B sorting domain-containing protein [Paludibacteraceae bacterium]